MYVTREGNRFKKEYKRVRRNPQFDIRRFKEVAQCLLTGETLPLRYNNHRLKGEFSGSYECHLHPDILLVYEIDEKTQTVCLQRIGSHSELFG